MKFKLKQFAITFIRTSILLLAFFLLYCPSLYAYKKMYLCLILATLVGFSYLRMIIHEKKIDRLLPILCVFIAVVLISTFINGRDLNYAIYYEGFLCLAVYMLFAIGLHYDANYFLLVFYFYCIMIIVWNLFTFPNPIWTYARGQITTDIDINSLIGNANIQVVFLLPALFSGYILMERKYLKGPFAIILYSLVYALCLFCGIFFDEKNTTIVLILWGLFLLLGHFLPLEKGFPSYLALGLQAPIFIGLQFYDSNNPGIIGKAIELIGGTVTIDGRTPIWEVARSSIAKNPIIGVGTASSLMGIVFDVYHHAHNLFFNVLLKVGAIGFSVFLWVLLELARAINRIGERRIKWACILFFFCFLLNLEFDTYAAHYLYGILGLLYFVSLKYAKPEEKEKLFWNFNNKIKTAID